MNIILFKFTYKITGEFIVKNEIKKRRFTFTLTKGATHVALSPTKVKLAFTLAEVLITLGIIGVVAAMTIPTLISNYQKHIVEANLQESYSIIQQVMKYTEYDDVSFDVRIPDSLEGMKLWSKTFLEPHLKYGKICYDTAGCWQAKTPTKNLKGGVAQWNRTGVGLGSGIITIKLTNGANLCLDGFVKSDMKTWFGTDISDPTSMAIYIDANGDKGPNIIGKDIYIVAYTPDGLVPAGFSETNETVKENCSKNATAQNAGYYCINLVKANGWKIPDDIWKLK